MSGPYSNILPACEQAWTRYLKPICDMRDDLNWYTTLQWMEAQQIPQPDGSFLLQGITAPFVSVLCGEMTPAAPDGNLDDPDQMEKGVMSFVVRTLAKDDVQDGLVIPGAIYHWNLVGKIKDCIYWARDRKTQVRTKIEVVINALNTPGVTICKVSRPSQSKTIPRGSTYETIITVPFQACPKA